jgi:hypothetical protein
MKGTGMSTGITVEPGYIKNISMDYAHLYTEMRSGMEIAWTV